jgi:hypothetical protein
MSGTKYYLTVNGGSGSGYHDLGSSVPISATIPVGYVFNRWVATDYGPIANPYSANTTVTTYGNFTVTATFTSALYIVNYNANAGGHITGDTAQGGYYAHYLTTVTAVADPAYEFIGWSDGNPNASRTDICYGNATYYANFQLVVPTPPVVGNTGNAYAVWM